MFNARDTIRNGVVGGILTFDTPTLSGQEWPAVEITGGTAGPRLCVMAGMHVNEVSSIEAAVRLMGFLVPEQLRGTVSIIPVLNLPALPYRSQYVCPVDGKNINFSFPGGRGGSFSEALADAVLNQWAADADVLADLHGGDLCEDVSKFSICQLTGDPAFDARNLALARCFDTDLVAALDASHMDAPGRACTARSRQRRHAVMSEGGAHGMIDPVSVAFHLHGLLNVMVMMGMIDGPAIPPTREQVLLETYLWVPSPVDGLFYAQAEPAARVQEGQVLATLADTFGRRTGEIRSPASGRVIWRITHGMVRENEQVFGIGVPFGPG
jgi:predicted deacylase